MEQQEQQEPQAFGPLLRAHRHAADLTLEELSERSGVSGRAIGDMERGHSRGPQPRTVAALAEALELSPDDTAVLLAAARSGRRRQRPIAARPCELPSPVPDFTGRETEVDWLGRTTADPRLPRVSIVSGAPGLGKTALVLHAGERLTESFTDGCLFLDLRGLDTEPLTPHDALGRLLRALGLRERDLPTETDERQALYRRLLKDRDVLIVLDNAAHEGQLRALLPGPGHGTVWVTSRRTLTGIEHARRLVLKPLPATAATTLLGAILALRDEEPQDGSAAADPSALARIADLCGNLPLALRIAGNRLLSRPAWSARSLADRLGDEELRLGRLAAGDLRIRSAFQLSYDQLTQPIRRLFRRLALVPGPDFDAGLGSALTGLAPGSVEEMLDELLELGLLSTTATDRMLFHDLIRLYARERLDEEESPQDRRAAETAMHTWLLDTAQAAGCCFQPDGPRGAAVFATPKAAQAWLEAESANWLAALRTAAEDGRHAEVVRTAESMHWFSDRWTYWGHWHEVFGLSRAAAHALGDHALEATHTSYLAWAQLYCLNQPREALATAEQAIELAHLGGDVVQEAWAAFYAAGAANRLRELGGAVALARRSAELFAAAGDREGHPQALLALAGAEGFRGDHAAAVATLDTVIGLLTAPATAPTAAHIVDFTMANALSQKGEALLALNRPGDAERAYAEALRLGARLGVPMLQAAAALGLARALDTLGDRERALAAVRKAIELAEAAGDTDRKTEAVGLLSNWTSAPVI
ncbi:helix-turn-helix transcriptional regulator [Kitasatospora sp. RB6PN24]|uniref:helix-turn-helix domain-containing protein n=1 Tax=Kitasatospora humi TaxID=2893891 RepID=UPI001E5EE20A|nr:helix-turn-helix transcriptional regulator [Kitasatospora humi]MCC9311457.1 helix-turn-helix transcriptional regulator [Kitasatospora humi]